MLSEVCRKATRYMKTKMTTLVIFIVCGLLASSVDAAITSWSKPVIDTQIGSATHTTLIPENTPTGGTGVTVTATSDATGTPDITYALIADSTFFSIEANTGVISTTASLTLDYETTTSYEIKVTAKDGTETDNNGDPTATATITLNVGNVGPVFAQLSYTKCIQQGSPDGTTKLTATSEETGTITYSIENNEAPNDLFAINQSSGEVTTVKAPEQVDRYNLTIQAVQNGEPTTTQLIIDVKETCSSASKLPTLSIVFLLAAFVASIN